MMDSAPRVKIYMRITDFGGDDKRKYETAAGPRGDAGTMNPAGKI
jgi:hypothetical protein